MTRFKDKYLEQLFADERFSPIRQKLKMLETAEELVGIISPGQKYPFEFVCYKITGYRPDTQPNPHLIDANILLSDLLYFILATSKKISQPVQMLQEPFYTTDQVAKKLKISEKTVSRWRAKGLVSRSFIFEDGKRKVAILESSLDRFLEKNSTLVDKSSQFSRLTEQQREDIVSFSLKLAQYNPQWSRQKLIREVASHSGRAVETVRYTLVTKFKNCNDKMFSNPAVMLPHEAAVIYSSYKNGTPVKALMEHHKRSRSSIYRIINQQKVRHIAIDDIQYIDSEDFASSETVAEILAVAPESELNIPTTDIDNLSGNISKINQMPLLTRDQELELFRLYNCLKFEAKRLSSCRGYGGTKGIGKVEMLLSRAGKIKDVLVCSNLRLVVSIARNHMNRGASLSDLVSDGSVALMRAVEGYNYKKGFRFATYASWAITRSFAGIMPDSSLQLGGDIDSLHSDMRRDDIVAVPAIEQAGEDLELVIVKNLNEREQYVIRNHFGLDGSLIRKNYKSMKQIGEDLGISGERVRQIELQALQKLRHCLSSEMFESLLK